MLSYAILLITLIGQAPTLQALGLEAQFQCFVIRLPNFGKR